MATANPATNVAVYRRAGLTATGAGAMTLQGAVVKTALLTGILLVTATLTWSQTVGGEGAVSPLGVGLVVLGLIGGSLTALVTIFVPRVSPVTAPVYAALEGLVLGGISGLVERQLPGVVLQAVGLTVGILVSLLVIYGAGLIRVTENFKIAVVAATCGICLVYLADFVARLFGLRIPFIHETGWVGILFSLFVVVIASANLILDFDFIEKGVEGRAPRFMEWYGAFSLMVTLIWLYLEVLRLLVKLRDRE
jgi:uncharacterized YccA/Bax inhibitor family protein